LKRILAGGKKRRVELPERGVFINKMNKHLKLAREGDPPSRGGSRLVKETPPTHLRGKIRRKGIRLLSGLKRPSRGVSEKGFWKKLNPKKRDFFAL